MKARTQVLGVLVLFTGLITSSLVQGPSAWAQSPTDSRFGLSSGGSVTLQCELTQVAGKLKDGTPFYLCRAGEKQFQLVLIGVKLMRESAMNDIGKIQLGLQCTVAVPVGVFAYGGETIGFRNNQKFFYAVGKPEQTSGGRCFVSGNRSVMTGLVMNRESGILLAPVQTQFQTQYR
jgi:hypothetical protein